MKKHIIYIVSALMLTMAWSCSSSKAEEHNDQDGHDHSEHSDHDGHNHNEQTEAEESHGDEVNLSAEQAQTIGLEVVNVQPGKFNQVIKTSGQILSAQGDEVTISATASGIVSFNKASLNEGASVNSGESLLSISSKNIVDGDPIARAKASYDIANQEYQRAESLIKDQLISRKEYNDIKLNFENAKITYQSIGRTTNRGVSISTPISGYIKVKMASEGQYVEIGQPLLTVTQNRKLQLRADVSERYYKDLSNISSANFKTSYDDTVYSISEMDGRLVSFGRGTNSNDFLIPVNFEFQNLGNIVAGSYVEVFLLGLVRDNVISVPVSSLIEDQGVYSVYLQVHPETYKKQEVKIGANDGTKVEIVSGLKDGDKVVSKGTHHLKLASTSSSIPHGHEH